MTIDVTFLLVAIASVYSFILVFIVLWKNLRGHGNLGLEKARDTCIQLTASAKKELKIVTDLCPEIFEDPKILFVFHDALNNNVQIKILHDPSFNLEKVPQFKKLVDESCNKIIVKKMDESPPYHFWVADERNLRLEDPHPPGDITNVKADIRFNTLKLGVRYERIFDMLWIK